jgi:hypothetical protein
MHPCAKFGIISEDINVYEMDISRAILCVIDLLAQALDEDVVHPPAPLVHRDRDVSVLENAGEVEAGKLAALVGVEDRRRAIAAQRVIQRIDAELHIHGVRQPPRQNLAAHDAGLATKLPTDRPDHLGLVFSLKNRSASVKSSRRPSNVAPSLQPISALPILPLFLAKSASV